MAEVSITKPLMIAASPLDQALIMRGLAELPARETRALLNRLEQLIVNNEAPIVQQAKPAQLKPVSEQARDAGESSGSEET